MDFSLGKGIAVAGIALSAALLASVMLLTNCGTEPIQIEIKHTGTFDRFLEEWVRPAGPPDLYQQSLPQE